MRQSWTGIEIAPDFTIAEWQSLHGQLDPESYDENWQTLIDHVRNRLEKRFLEPADILLEHEQEHIQKGSSPEGLGFSVLAIDCLLIETLCGYEQGQRTRRGGTHKAFENFLNTAPRFKDAFGHAGRAGDFADAIRNGLLHDGETRKGWIIWQGRPDGPIVADFGDGLLRLYRSAFHNALKEYVIDYFERLRAADGTQLRRNLESRINQLCEDSAPMPDSS